MNNVCKGCKKEITKKTCTNKRCTNEIVLCYVCATKYIDITIDPVERCELCMLCLRNQARHYDWDIGLAFRMGVILGKNGWRLRGSKDNKLQYNFRKSVLDRNCEYAF